MDIKRINLNPQNIAFKGHKKELDKTGCVQHDFYYLYDPSKYKCELELYNIGKDKYKNYHLLEKDSPAAVIPMKDSRLTLDMTEIPEVYSEKGFAYRFKLTDKNTNEVSYAFDSGSVLNIDDLKNANNKYNLVFNNRAMINKNGNMQLIMPDSFNPGVVNENGQPKLNEALRQKALNSVRTHANKLGGNFYGIIEKLPQLEKEGIVRVVGTPFTKDNISSHKYWTENAFLVSPDFGTEEDFKTMQEEFFKHGINWIADAALVNEGFSGVHMSELLRKGQESTSKNMFRADEKITLGIIPDKSKYTRLKLINAPVQISSDGKVSENEKYDFSKPTYIQFYDDRLVSEAQKNSDKPFYTYAKNNTDNVCDITKHDDAVYPYSLEVNPQELERNVLRIAKKNKTVDLSNVNTMKQITDFSTFNVGTKGESAGLEVWDGNVDIAKMNFYRCFSDDSRFTKLPPEERMEAVEDFERGTLAVRDYAINSGKYWTQTTADTQLHYVSKLLENAHKTPEGYMSAIKEAVANGDMPKSALKCIDKEVIENVLDDNYYLKRLYEADTRNPINPEGINNDYNVDDYVLKHVMDVPLETMPFATNIIGILTNPYIAKKANIDDELGVSRYDIYKAGNPNLPDKYKYVYSQVESIYANQIMPIISSAVKSIPGVEGEDGEVTEYGRYVISEVAPELTKYLFTRALNPDADIELTKDYKFDFTNVNPDDTTMQSLGIPYNSLTSEEEAQKLVDIIRKGTKSFDKNEYEYICETLNNRFSNRTLNDFKVAEMIIDRTESGLGWRIDAAKDIASIDAVRSGYEDMGETWNKVIDFWKRYNQGVLEINPHAYTTAEITDLSMLLKSDPEAEFKNDADAERKFIEETGITCVANYNYLFTMPPMLYSNYNPDDDNLTWMSKESKNLELRKKLIEGWVGNPGYLYQGTEDGVLNSYNFVGNHDKERIINKFALDMYLYNTVPLTEAQRKNATPEELERDNLLKQTASKVLNKQIKDINFEEVSPKSVAMGARIYQAIDDCINEKAIKNVLKTSLTHLAADEYKGYKIDPDTFGTRNFETAIKILLDDAENEFGKIPSRKEIEKDLLKSILVPAFDRLQSVTKLLTLLPGSFTDFAGDKLGVSGAETKAKNYHQQNRNTIPWEYLTEKGYEFIANNYKDMNEISSLRSNTNRVLRNPDGSRIKLDLSAINDGATVVLPLNNDYVQSFMRYNDAGSNVLVITDISGSSTDINKRLNRNEKLYSDETKTDKKQNGNKTKEIKLNSKGYEIKDGHINSIPLNIDGATLKEGLKHGMIEGTVFRNVRENDNSIYKICKDENGKYNLKRFRIDGQSIPIVIDNDDKNALVLCKVQKA